MGKDITVKEFCKSLAKVYKLLNWKWSGGVNVSSSDGVVTNEKMILNT